MLFLALTNADVEFTKLRQLTWKSYIVIEDLSTTNRVEFIAKKEFAKAALNKNSETFIIYVTHYFRSINCDADSPLQGLLSLKSNDLILAVL